LGTIQNQISSSNALNKLKRSILPLKGHFQNENKCCFIDQRATEVVPSSVKIKEIRQH
jgi:hypothetical protein